MNIAILGAGMVGRTIAADLSKKYNVTSLDINEGNLALLPADQNIIAKKYDLMQFDSYPSLLAEFDLVVNAVPGFMGYKTLEAIIRSKKNVADISFFPENALDLNNLAKENNITAIVDCGVAPGMSNLILGYYDSIMNIESFECLVGGLPKQRIKPFEYKAPFSPIDVIEEYIRPARYVENSHVIIKPALSEAELINFEQVGTLESFNTDGLRSILFTMDHIPCMKEKTLRYPGHIALIKSLQDAGFFDTTPVNVKGSLIRPIDLTTSLLFDQWKLKYDEPEFTIMKIILKGTMNDIPVTIEYNLFDEYDVASGTSSMSRTTGYTCTAVVNLILENHFNKKGVYPPELVGSNKNCFDFIINYLDERNVKYHKTISKE